MQKIYDLHKVCDRHEICILSVRLTHMTLVNSCVWNTEPGLEQKNLYVREVDLLMGEVSTGEFRINNLLCLVSNMLNRGRYAKCQNHRNQRLCKMFRAWVNFLTFVVNSICGPYLAVFLSKVFGNAVQ